MAATDSGYDPVVVFDWLDTHCTKRSDGRYLTIEGQLIDDSHRDTFARWEEWMYTQESFVVPLGRLDEILYTYGIHLWELEDWAQGAHGWDGYLPGSQY